MKGKIVLALLVLSLLVFADMGLTPDYTHIRVTFTKDGGDYRGPVYLIYHCQDPEVSPGEGMIETVEAELSCSNGICNNYNTWFPRSNPCYNSKRGYFRYRVSEDAAYLSTALITLNESSVGFTIDLDSGGITKTEEPPSPCPLALMPLALAALALFMCKK